MTHLLFLQGAGAGAHREDSKIVSNLEEALGQEYLVHYPKMPDEEEPSIDAWTRRIDELLAEMPGPVSLVGHSMGGSILARHLSEGRLRQDVTGVFLMAAPFWGGEGWLFEGWEELALPDDAAARLDSPVFLYHCRDDEVVPFEHVELFARLLPDARLRTFDSGGHQFESGTTYIAQDIRSAERTG